MVPLWQFLPPAVHKGHWGNVLLLHPFLSLPFSRFLSLLLYFTQFSFPSVWAEAANEGERGKGGE